MKPENLKSIVYISLPESLTKNIGSFKINPEIMLPAELGEEPSADELSKLGWEMILAGMLKILAFDPHNEHSDYYRSFVLAVKPEIMEELSQTGILKAKNKDWDLAEELFLALTGLQPGDPRATLNLALMYDQRSQGYGKLGNEYLQRKQEEKAFHYYLKAISERPELPEAHLYVGYFFLRQQSFGRAKKEFSKFLKISDDREKKAEVRELMEQLKGSSERDALFNEAFDFIRLGKEKEGLQKIEEFLDIQPDVWNAWFLKGWALRRLARYADAYTAFSTARSRGGNSADLLNEMAICAMEEERYEESIDLLEDALEISGQDVKILSNLGICCIKLKRLENAREYFLRVLDMDEKDQIAIQYLSYMEEQL